MVLRKAAVVAVVALAAVAGCKAKLHTFTVEERIAADAHKPGRLPQEALHCQVFFGGTIEVKVKDLRDDYSGVVHVRATETPKPCDGDFEFRMERSDSAPAGRRRNPDLDVSGWDLTELRPIVP